MSLASRETAWMARRPFSASRWGAVLAGGVFVLGCSACTGEFRANDCGAPALVTVSGDPLDGHTAIELWQPRGRSRVLTADPAAYEPEISPDGRTMAFALGEGPWSDSTGYDRSRVAVLSVATREVT